MAVELEVNRQRIQRLMRILGIEALYPKPNLSRPAPGHQIYPYLLRGVEILPKSRLEHRYYLHSDAGQLPLPGRGGGLVQPLRAQLGAVQYNGNRLLPGGAGRCVPLRPARNLELRSGFAVHLADFLAPLKKRGISISMDGRGRALDNVFVERLWRSVKYELIYPGDFATGLELFPALESYFHFYNHQRPHQALGYQTPAESIINPADEQFICELQQLKR